MNRALSDQDLKKFDLLRNISDSALSDVAKSLTYRVVDAGEIIINQGEVGDSIYFLKSGSCKAYIIDKHGNEIKLSVIRPYQTFGELVLLSVGPRTCYIKTLEKCELLHLTKESLDELLSKHHTISLALNKMLADRLRDTLQVISKSSDNYPILIKYDENNKIIYESFIKYFNQISIKEVIFIDSSISNDEFNRLNASIKDHYIIIRNCNDRDFMISRDCIKLKINFIENIDCDIYIPDNASDWMVGHIVRKILNKRIGIALCSGGAPAAAHIGVLKVLHQSGIPLDFIAGTSAGAIFGACYSFGIDPYLMLNEIITMSKASKFKLLLKHHGKLNQGLFKQSVLEAMLSKYFSGLKIEDANIPFAAVASDLYTGKTIVMDNGPVIDAIIASNSAPVIFQPVRHNDMLLIDGVATSPLPTKILIDKSIEIKIAVPIPQLDLATTMNENSKILPIFLRSRSMMANEIVHSTTELADVIIEPLVNNISVDDWSHSSTVLVKGEDAAMQAISRIQLLFNSS